MYFVVWYNLLMPTKDRYLTKPILEDLKEKMVFLAGPRQVGKTTLATELIGKKFKSLSLNWDKLQERNQALKGEWPDQTELIILDEFHKHRRWKTWIKGEYDTYKDKYKFLLTGSARLNVYRKGGDSLQGRYYYYHFHPFSLSEMINHSPQTQSGSELVFSQKSFSQDCETLLHFGGFPEPLFKQETRHLRRWQTLRMERFLKEDIRDLTLIQDIGNLSLLCELLPEKIKSPLSINSLSEDLQVNFRTIANWIKTFEELYYCYLIPPFQTRRITAVKKEKKLYLWDWSLIEDESARLENLVASHLLKYCHFLHDHDGLQATLHFIRDNTGRETDFLVCLKNKPWFAVKVKTKDTTISKNLLYFQKKLKIPYCYQVVDKTKKDFLKNEIRVLPLAKFLTAFV